MSQILHKSQKNCTNCHQKDSLIGKYTSLINLLKKQNQKTKSSLVQSRSDSSSQSSHLNIGPKFVNIAKTIQKIVSKKQYGLISACFCKLKVNRNETLATFIISNKCKKALLNQCFSRIKSAITHEKQPQCLQVSQNGKLFQQSSKSNMINTLQSTLTFGKQIYSSKINDYTSKKGFYTKLFVLQVQNSQKDNKIKSLMKSLQDSQKRYYKETQKKRESLETVAEQIRQKNQIIQQLTNLIKKYECQIVLKSKTDNLLIEDYDDLKSTVQRLQNINNKLNFDLRDSQQKILQFKEKINELQEKVKLLNSQNLTLKQSNFDLTHHTDKSANMKKSLQSLCQKFNKKIQQLRLFQKEININSKLLPKQFSLFSSQQILGIQSKSLKKLAETTEFVMKPSLKEINIQSKVESIITYLFHIDNQAYEVANAHLFDQQELQVLKNHKELFLSKAKGSSKMFQQNGKMKIQKIQSHDETDEIFYFDQGKLNQNSFLDAFDQKVQCPKVASPKGDQISSNLKLIQLQIQKNNKIQKISQLKNRYMHIRNVILNLLKSLQLKNMNLKSQIQGILQIVFDIFQYSQEQKNQIFKQKKKRYFGLI